MKARWTGIVMAALAGLALAVGCSSSSSGSPSSASIFCSAMLAGTEVCYGYTNLNADQQNSVNNSCKQSLMGSVVSSCPTSNLAGCCKYTTGGIATEECYYNGSSDAGGGGDAGSSSSVYQQACMQQMGTWSTSQ